MQSFYGGFKKINFESCRNFNLEPNKKCTFSSIHFTAQIFSRKKRQMCTRGKTSYQSRKTSWISFLHINCCWVVYWIIRTFSNSLKVETSHWNKNSVQNICEAYQTNTRNKLRSGQMRKIRLKREKRKGKKCLSLHSLCYKFNYISEFSSHLSPKLAVNFF